MWQINFCPRCGAQAGYGDRFCGACGLNLTSVVSQVPPPSYDYHCTYQQWVPHTSPYIREEAYMDSDQSCQRCAYAGGDTVTPLSAEISKLLAGFFSRRLKQSKV